MANGISVPVAKRDVTLPLRRETTSLGQRYPSLFEAFLASFEKKTYFSYTLKILVVKIRSKRDYRKISMAKFLARMLRNSKI